MSQLDQRAQRLTATGQVFGQRCRLHSIYYIGAAAAGLITLRDGGAGGVVKVDIDTPITSASVPMHIYIGEEAGVLFSTNMHCSALGVTGATFFFTA